MITVYLSKPFAGKRRIYKTWDKAKAMTAPGKDPESREAVVLEDGRVRLLEADAEFYGEDIEAAQAKVLAKLTDTEKAILDL